MVLPPLLFAVTQRTTVTEFRRHLAAVAWLAIGLTLATAAVVAVVAHACRLSWTTAAILGAVVSPPDPVAGSLWFTSVGTELVLAVVVGC